MKKFNLLLLSCFLLSFVFNASIVFAQNVKEVAPNSGYADYCVIDGQKTSNSILLENNTEIFCQTNGAYVTIFEPSGENTMCTTATCSYDWYDWENHTVTFNVEYYVYVADTPPSNPEPDPTPPSNPEPDPTPPSNPEVSDGDKGSAAPDPSNPESEVNPLAENPDDVNNEEPDHEVNPLAENPGDANKIMLSAITIIIIGVIIGVLYLLYRKGKLNKIMKKHKK